MNNRDDFKQQTKEIAARRVGYLCSCPTCRCMTISASAEGNNSYKNVGEAAHICAASPGGKRYNDGMTSIERSSVDNCIWLCSYHARIIDRDEVTYSVELLRQWKKDAESYAMRQTETIQKMADNSSELIEEWYLKFDILTWPTTTRYLLQPSAKMFVETREKIGNGLVWLRKVNHLFSQGVSAKMTNFFNIMQALIDHFDKYSELHEYDNYSVYILAPYRHDDDMYSDKKDYNACWHLLWELTFEATKALNDIMDLLRNEYLFSFSKEKINLFYTTNVLEEPSAVFAEYVDDENRIFCMEEFVRDPLKRLYKE